MAWHITDSARVAEAHERALLVVSRVALDAGATDVVLFTDLANPTSNALYQRLGFTRIDDRRTLEFPA